MLNALRPLELTFNPNMIDDGLQELFADGFDVSHNNRTNATFSSSEPPQSLYDQLATSLPDVLRGFLMYNPYVLSSLYWFIFGTVLDMGRSVWTWLVGRLTEGIVPNFSPPFCPSLTSSYIRVHSSGGI